MSSNAEEWVMDGDPPLKDALDTLGIAWKVHEHAAVFTVDDSDAIHAAMPGVHTKNLFLKDAGDRFWLVTVPSAISVDLKALPTVIGSRKLSFGKAEAMQELLGIAPGSVSPLAALNDTENVVTVVLDAGVAAGSQVNVHPLRNTATIGLSGADLVRALSAWDHVPIIVAVPARLSD
jgi:Ala-tRNA(Pro) deacylase